jgi:transposase
MTSVGMDLGKKQSDVCVIDERDAVVERSRVRTGRDALSKRFANTPRCRIAIESCRDTGWVFDHLTSLGHEVVVVDTTRARALGIGQGRRKTDRRDAEALARAVARGVVPQAHVLSAAGRELRDALHARDQLVRVRGRLVTMLRGQFQGRGWATPRCATGDFATRLRSSGLPGVEAPEVQALLAVLRSVTTEIEQLERHLAARAARHEAVARLSSVPGVKLIVSLTVIAALDDATRFKNAHQVQAYLGLVPSEYSTGGKRRTGGITRCGNALARRMLVQAARSLLRTRRAQQDPLVVWARQVAARRGQKRAVIGVARRLVGILWAMWVDGTCYDPQGLARQSFAGLSRRARRAQQDAALMANATRSMAMA